MGGRASKACTPSGDVEGEETQGTGEEEARLVSRLSPFALDRAGRKEKAEEAHEARWLQVEKGIEAKARGALEGKQQDDCPFVRLPPELVECLLSFLDYEALLLLGQTCAWAYGLIHHQQAALVISKLSGHVLKCYPHRQKKPQFATSLVSDKTVPIDHDDEEREDKQQDEAKRASLSKEEEAVRRILTSSMAHHAARSLPASQDVRREFERVFHPMTQDRRMAVLATIRVFSIPKALHYFKDKLPSAVARGLSGASVRSATSEEAEAFREADAWSGSGGRSTIHFRSALTPVTSAAQLDAILQETKNLKSWLWGDKTMSVRVPSVQTALDVLALLVNSPEVMLWQDLDFEIGGYAGLKFVVLGAAQAAVVQWEYYSNHCGGPYATYSCGMG